MPALGSYSFPIGRNGGQRFLRCDGQCLHIAFTFYQRMQLIDVRGLTLNAVSDPKQLVSITGEDGRKGSPSCIQYTARCWSFTFVEVRRR